MATIKGLRENNMTQIEGPIEDAQPQKNNKISDSDEIDESYQFPDS